MSDRVDFITALLLKASIDYELFSLTFSQRKDLAEGGAFHGQQAVEKWLKALLVQNLVKPPRTHDLIYLCELLNPMYPQLMEAGWLRMADYLSDFAVDVRYVDEAEPKRGHDVDLIQVQEAVEAFHAFAKGELAPYWKG